MKCLGLLFVFLPLVMFARPIAVPTLPPSDFADTESSTNIVINANDKYWGKLDIRLAANATASNNVQIAFGTDANAKSVLHAVYQEVGANYIKQNNREVFSR